MIDSAIKLVLKVWLVALTPATGQLPRATYAMGQLAMFADQHQMSLGAFNRSLTGTVNPVRLRSATKHARHSR